MYYVHNLAAAKGGGMPVSPSFLLYRTPERVVNDSVKVAPVIDRHEELARAIERLASVERMQAKLADSATTAK
ncbi:MAG: hypothetical protein KKG12_06810 [Gammaproteobacteria bacterium]|jgi:hypothetical protein|nr:hypothetical protein [Gammaproteobacteria bacterium]